LNQPFQVSADRCHELLGQAARARATITLDYRLGQRWVHRKYRLVGIDPHESLLLVDAGPSSVYWAARLEPGLNLTASFRHGHHKCVFTTSVVDVQEANPSGLSPHRVLRLLRPDEMHELQRRLYVRTRVPPNRMIPVDLWLAPREASRPGAAPRRGRMLDLSGGGMSLELPRDVSLCCRENDLLTCRFTAEPSRAALEIPTRLRHTSRLPDGRMRIGLQFVGLDASDDGRRTLQCIQRITAGLRVGV